MMQQHHLVTIHGEITACQQMLCLTQVKTERIMPEYAQDIIIHQMITVIGFLFTETVHGNFLQIKENLRQEKYQALRKADG